MSNTYRIAGKQVHCAQCGQPEFESRTILFYTRGATFFNVDWLNKGSTALTCQHCSQIEWFAQEPQVVGRSRLAGGR